MHECYRVPNVRWCLFVIRSGEQTILLEINLFNYVNHLGKEKPLSACERDLNFNYHVDSCHYHNKINEFRVDYSLQHLHA